MSRSRPLLPIAGIWCPSASVFARRAVHGARVLDWRLVGQAEGAVEDQLAALCKHVLGEMLHRRIYFLRCAGWSSARATGCRAGRRCRRALQRPSPCRCARTSRMHLPGGMSRITSNRLVQSDSHSGIGIMPASIRLIISLRNDGHQNVSKLLWRHEGVGRPVNGEEHHRMTGGARPGDRLLGEEDGRFVEHFQQFIFIAIEILHHAGGAAEVIGDQVVGSDRRADVRGRESLRRHAVCEVDMQVGDRSTSPPLS